MKLPPIALLFIPTVLAEVVSPAEPSSDCHANDCYRAVAGNDVRFGVDSRREDCSRVIAAVTATPLSTSGVPIYASLCHSVAAYSSACSCWGATADKPTADAIPAAVAATVPAVSSLSFSASPPLPIIDSTSPTSTLPSIKSSVLSSPSLSSIKPPSTSPSSSPTTVQSSFSSSKSTLSPPSSIPTTTASTTPSSSIISTPPASTNPTSGGCTGGKCGTYKAWACSGPLRECLCRVDADGSSFCLEDNECSLETNCAANEDCPSSQKCVVGSCCLVGKCVIERKDGVCGNGNSARALFRVRERRCADGRNSGTC